MQYVIYFVVATPLVLAGLLWASATLPPQPPMFNTGYNAIHTAAPAAVPAQINKAVVDSSDTIPDKVADKKS